MATPTERDILATDILEPIGRRTSTFHDSPLTEFLSLQGIKYNNELMIVGRAVNGWMDDYPTNANTLSDPANCRSYANRLLHFSTTDSCEMDWVVRKWGDTIGTCNTKRSPFWRVIKKMTIDLFELKDD